MADAKVYQKTTPAPEKVVILNVRGYHIAPFIAPNWMDLRVGFFLSLTSALDDDTTTGLAETMVSGSVWDRYYIGVWNPTTTVFAGFTNGALLPGDSMLVSSDAALGTTPANFWRPANSSDNTRSFEVHDSNVVRLGSPDGLQQHFVQNPAGAGGYAVLLGFQLLRDNPQSKTVRVNIKSSGHSADMLYSNTPTLDLLRNALQTTWPPSKQIGPVSLTAVPDSLYFYWPFRNSRLRIHAYQVVKTK